MVDLSGGTDIERYLEQIRTINKSYRCVRRRARNGGGGVGRGGRLNDRGTPATPPASRALRLLRPPARPPRSNVVDKLRLIKGNKRKTDEKLDLLNTRQALKEDFIGKKQVRPLGCWAVCRLFMPRARRRRPPHCARACAPLPPAPRAVALAQAARANIALVKAKVESLAIVKEKELKDLQEEFREIDSEFKELGVLAEREELFEGAKRGGGNDPSKMNNDQLLGAALDIQKQNKDKLKEGLQTVIATKETAMHTAATLEQDREKITVRAGAPPPRASAAAQPAQPPSPPTAPASRSASARAWTRSSLSSPSLPSC